MDAVTDGTGVDTQTLNISSMPVGDYVVKLIVYDRLSLKSQPGRIMDANERIEREVEITKVFIRS